MNEEIKTNMIYDYFRWFHWPRLTYRKVEPVEPVDKEFPMEKHGQHENAEEQPKKEQEQKRPGQILSIWV